MEVTHAIVKEDLQGPLSSDCFCPLCKNIMYPQIWLYSWVPEQEDIEQIPSQSTAGERVTRLPVDDVWHEQQWPSIGEATRIQGHWLCNITENKHSS